VSGPVRHVVTLRSHKFPLWMAVSKVSVFAIVFVGVVWTGGQNGKKSMRFQMKTASCGRGLKWYCMATAGLCTCQLTTTSYVSGYRNVFHMLSYPGTTQMLTSNFVRSNLGSSALDRYTMLSVLLLYQYIIY
jgi:hypothetical protein